MALYRNILLYLRLHLTTIIIQTCTDCAIASCYMYLPMIYNSISLNSKDGAFGHEETTYLNVLSVSYTGLEGRRTEMHKLLKLSSRQVTLNAVHPFLTGHYKLSSRQELSDFIEIMNAVLRNDGSQSIVLDLFSGGQFTMHMKENIRNLKAFFGEEFVKKWCILIVQLDISDKQMLIKYKSFEDLVSEQSDEIQELIKECNGRVLFFVYDPFADKAVFQSNADRLVEMVLIHQIEISGRRFFKEFLKKAVLERCKLDMTDIVDQLEGINSLDIASQLQKLDVLLIDISHLLDDILNQDNENGTFQEIIRGIRSLKMNILEQTSKAQDAELAMLNRNLVEEKRLTMNQKEKMIEERDELIIKQMRLNEEKSKVGALAVAGNVLGEIYNMAKSVMKSLLSYVFIF